MPHGLRIQFCLAVSLYQFEPQFLILICVFISALKGYYLLPGKIGGPNDIWLCTHENVVPFHMCLD